MLALFPTLALAAPDIGSMGVGAPPVAARVEPPPLLAPLPTGTTLERVDTHAEYVRYHLRADRAFVVEITRDRGGTPVCADGGLALWVRTDLSATGESFVWDPLPPVVTQACAALGRHPPAFASRDGATDDAASGRPASERAGDRPGDRPGERAGDQAVADAHATDAGTADAGALPADGSSRRAPPAWRWRPLHAVVVPLLALLLWRLPRDRVALGAGLLALAVRLALSRPTVLLGGDAAYERLLRARGTWDPDPYYGEAWPAFMGLLWRALGTPDHFVHAVNIALSALTVPFAVALARRVTAGAAPTAAGDRATSLAAHATDNRAASLAALATGLLLALHPLVVAAAGMEDVFVLVGLLQVVAVVTALESPRSPDPGTRPDPRASRTWTPDPWCAALATGLLVHLRPEQGVFALLPLALLARRRAWAPLAVAAALCGWRAVELLGLRDAVGHGADVLGWWRWLRADFVGDLLAPGANNPLLLLAPARSPLAFAALVAVGVSGLRENRRLAIPLAALALPLAVVLPKTEPFADPVRFQLAGFTFAAVLAGAGLARFHGRPKLVAAWVTALALTTIPARAPLDGGWAWSHEYDHLRAHLAAMPPGATVLYRPDQDPFGHFGAWVDAVSPGAWRPLGGAGASVLTGAASPATFYWRGFADAVAGVWPPLPCDLDPVAVSAVPARTDGWITLPDDTLEVGLYRVGECSQP